MPSLWAEDMSKPLLLDLFCGAGGAAMGYHRAGFDIVGVDHKLQPNYPFEFILADAMEYSLEYSWGHMVGGFDVVHASPPCQAYVQRNKHLQTGHPKLIAPMRAKLRKWGGVYVIENVLPEVLVTPMRICGTALGLGVIRHRFFEIPSLAAFDISCVHQGTVSEGDYAAVYARGGKGPRRGKGNRDPGPLGEGPNWGEAMGIDWMTDKELTQAIPPAYTEYIGRELIKWLG